MLILKPLTVDWSVAGADIPAVTFIAQAGFPARELAHMLDSLVRVSRRVEWNHSVTNSSQESPVNRSEGEFYKAHSLTRRRVTMSLEVYSMQLRTDVDTQGKKHPTVLDQNPLVPLR